ncbi:hypothetical protein EVAR_63790_1 [Eumeta japonica]|uniref:Uncharacterized protein n=1 Tax=Eumeta variegata TaxID=151549 RepID=A0A4C1ZE62_EUMVA|nr:hypothetical protein EVAR_63790_1 [Eumeta japonica]
MSYAVGSPAADGPAVRLQKLTGPALTRVTGDRRARRAARRRGDRSSFSFVNRKRNYPFRPRCGAGRGAGPRPPPVDISIAQCTALARDALTCYCLPCLGCTYVIAGCSMSKCSTMKPFYKSEYKPSDKTTAKLKSPCAEGSGGPSAGADGARPIAPDLTMITSPVT